MANMRGYTPCGSEIENVYGFSIDKNGKKIFGVTGTTNTYQKIQAAVVGSTLYEMIDKYQRTGDDSFLRQNAKGFFADITAVPKNVFDVQRIKTKSVDDFNKYPIEFRAMFNHNVDDYFASIMDGSIREKFTTYFKKNNVDVKAEVEIGEQVTK